MTCNYRIIFLFILIPLLGVSQNAFKVEGKVIENTTGNPLPGVRVHLAGTALSQETETDGTFKFTDVPAEKYTLRLESTGYILIDFPIVVNAHLNLGNIPLKKDITREKTINIIALTENDLDNDSGGIEVTSNLLQASRDVFSNIAAFEFGQTFFKVRGLAAENGVILINAVKMNTLFNGRPQWSNWGGLNDVLRNQELATASTPSDYHFGGLLGTTHISTRASGYRPGSRLSASSSNRSYAGRLIATYNSGLQNNTFAYSVSASRRWAEEGAVEGTLYDAFSLFGAFEYKINQDHSFNFTAIYTPNRRGKSSPNTQEVFDLKGIHYNSYWGYQNGKIRNSRIKQIQKPIFMLGHYWTINDKSKLNTNMAYQSGKTGNSRLDFGGTTAITTTDGSVYYSGGAPNPDPTYYKKLPSFSLSFNEDINYEEVYNRTEEFINNGQVNWNQLYEANQTNAANGRNAAYILYEDRNDDRQITANVIFNTNLSESIALDATVNYQNLKSENFASVLDLLGGTGYLDVDGFAEDTSSATNDLQNPNRIVQEGDRFKYNYNTYASIIDGFAQAKFKYNKIDFYMGGTIGKTTYQREGLYQNGIFPGNSLGKGKKLNFTSFGSKAGFTYKINARHLIDFNTAYVQNAPTLRNIFTNSRQNHDIVRDIKTQKTQAVDISYIVRSPIVKSRLTGYYYNSFDATEISFFFAGGLNGNTAAFVQEVLTGIEKRNIGLEFGIEAQVTSTIKLKGAAAIGEFIYNNNPDLYLTSDDFNENFPSLKSNLKNYKVAGGPQHAFSAGFEYRDPDFWWFGLSVNYFSNAYVDISPLNRTANFYSDAEGFPFPEYNEDIAKTLLKQEEFEDYYLVNLVGGKSWRILRKYYVGCFASISNVLNQEYKTGGFEQARNGNYRKLLEENQNEIPVFGSKYWFGRGTSYFINVYFNF